ncbi:hypothetical protein C815_00603 [Firmicutes bacterium M10-2]|nr:hypothetical protein C815_00603 [Firmicutes bacterium M10-2]
MSIFSKLEYMQGWTQAEKQLVQLILSDPTFVIEMTSRELAKKANTSLSTVYRVCEKLEVGGYADLRFQIMQELPRLDQDVANYDEPFCADNTDYEVIQTLASLKKETIDETASLIDLNTVRLIINRFEQAQDINLYTSSRYRNLALDFKFDMARLGKRVHVLTEVYDQELAVLQTRRDTLSIVITYAGRIREVRPILEYLKEHGHPVLLISSLWDNTYKKYCDYHLIIASKEAPTSEKIGQFSSMVSLQFIFDVLYSLFFKRNFEENLKLSSSKKLWSFLNLKKDKGEQE